MANTQIICPKCDSERLYKAGLRYLQDSSPVQRFLCRDCGYRFSESQSLNKQTSKGSFRQIGSTPSAHGLVKNLTELEPLKDRLAGATEKTDVKGKIIEYLWFLKKQGYAETTVKGRVQIIKRLIKLGCDLWNPESIKLLVAQHDDWSNNYKRTIIDAYDRFTEMEEIRWNSPEYKATEKLPFIPLEKEIDQLISGCGKKVATSLLLLKETGMRIGEAWKLEWTDFNEKNRNLKCTPEKHGRPRMFKVSSRLVSMLKALPKHSKYIFSKKNMSAHTANFIRQRRRLAKKLQNPRLEKITFHTLRHFYATMLYHKTKDILYVKQMLGHRSIQSTLIYTQLVDFENPEEYTCRIAENLEEARELIEAGFQYVTDIENKKLFRKRK